MEEYKPVSCNLYDELSNASILRQQASIYTTENETYSGVITDIFTKEKSEFCIIGNLPIRLDKIAKLTITEKNGESTTSLWSNPTCN